MDWTDFAENLLNRDNKNIFGNNQWGRVGNKLANPHLEEETNAKNHFSIQKTTLSEILEEVYFPVISP